MSWKTQKDAMEQDGFRVRIETPEPGNWHATLNYYGEPVYYKDEAWNPESPHHTYLATTHGKSRAAAISDLFHKAATFELWTPIILGAKKFSFDGQKYNRLTAG